jgi:hypothetical protein
MRFSFYILLLLFCIPFALCAQSFDSISIKADTQIVSHKYIHLDSATIARNLFVKDSIHHFQDSLIMQFIKVPKADRPNLFTEFLLKKYVITDKYLLHSISSTKEVVYKYGLGQVKPNSKYWILLVIVTLIILFSILRYYYASEIYLIFFAFFNTKAFNKMNKESNVFSSWQFLILYILFGFAGGLYLYLLTQGLGNIYEYKDIQLFVILSFFTIGFISIKILLLKLLGFVFHLQDQVKGYLNIFYITLFNILFMLLPMLLIVALIPHTFKVIFISLIILAIIYITTFIRTYVIVLSKYSFSKTYLILYICAFELCPILILMGALNIS